MERKKPVRITATEFRQNIGTYMKNVATTDYEVTRNGRVVGLWTHPNREKMELWKQLDGIIPGNITDEEVERLHEERILRRAGILPRHPEDDHETLS